MIIQNIKRAISEEGGDLTQKLPWKQGYTVIFVSEKIKICYIGI